MKKTIKILVVLLLVLTIVGLNQIYRDRQFLRENIVRLHVVANSNSAEDQNIKLYVRDAINRTISSLDSNIQSKEEMLAVIRDAIPQLESVANEVLEQCGVPHKAKVTLGEETFGKRIYDTFTLPSGVYDSLRIEIGAGEGKNWWCVLFPSLCIPAAGDDFQSTAVSAGFSQGLTNAVTNSGKFKVRFFLLDCFGKLENLFH